MSELDKTIEDLEAEVTAELEEGAHDADDMKDMDDFEHMDVDDMEDDEDVEDDGLPVLLL